jgi:four helix bundle protein
MKSNFQFAFEKLDVYHKAIAYGEHVHLQARLFPKDELYSLTSQFRRAADSIALNISEGYPGSDAQFIRHLNIAIYSANECVTCSTKAFKRNYIDFKTDEENRKLITELTKMLASLRSHVRNRSV